MIAVKAKFEAFLFFSFLSVLIEKYQLFHVKVTVEREGVLERMHGANMQKKRTIRQPKKCRTAQARKRLYRTGVGVLQIQASLSIPSYKDLEPEP